jgi:hypothetical protein
MSINLWLSLTCYIASSRRKFACPLFAVRNRRRNGIGKEAMKMLRTKT